MTPPPSLQDLIDTVRQDTGSDRLLDQLATAAATAAQLGETTDAMLGHFVDRCRRDGCSWTEISSALGVTKQAVHKRFAAGIADRIISANPAPTLERFTARARNVLGTARRAALETGSGHTGAVYILLGLFAEPDGIAAKVLHAIGVSLEGVRSAVEQLPAGTQQEPAGRGYTADGKQALRDALAEAIELGHNYIGTEHLLLGLYRNADSPAAGILVTAGATEAEARTRVLEMLRGFQQPRGG